MTLEQIREGGAPDAVRARLALALDVDDTLGKNFSNYFCQRYCLLFSLYPFRSTAYIRARPKHDNAHE